METQNHVLSILGTGVTAQADHGTECFPWFTERARPTAQAEIGQMFQAADSIGNAIGMGRGILTADVFQAVKNGAGLVADAAGLQLGEDAIAGLRAMLGATGDAESRTSAIEAFETALSSLRKTIRSPVQTTMPDADIDPDDEPRVTLG